MAKKWPIFRHTYFGNNSAIFGPISLKFSVGSQETIIYRLRLEIQLQVMMLNFIS